MSMLFLPRSEFLHFLLGRGTRLTPREKVKDRTRKLKQTKKRKGNKLGSVRHNISGGLFLCFFPVRLLRISATGREIITYDGFV
jgi:hypothetical protein